MFNPSEYEGSKKEQEEVNSGFQVPIPGVYDVIITGLGFVKVGNGSTLLNLKTKILHAVEHKNQKGPPEKAAKFVGKSFTWSLWFSDLLEKKHSTDEAKKLGFLCRACRVEDAFDPLINSQLAEAISGKAYRMKIKLREFESKKDKSKRKNVEAVWCQALPEELFSKYMRDPDVVKACGDPADRWEEDKDFSKPREEKQSETYQEDPFADPDEDPLPF